MNRLIWVNLIIGFNHIQYDDKRDQTHWIKVKGMNWKSKINLVCFPFYSFILMFNIRKMRRSFAIILLVAACVAAVPVFDLSLLGEFRINSLIISELSLIISVSLQCPMRRRNYWWNFLKMVSYRIFNWFRS